jgi:hypothetical protein
MSRNPCIVSIYMQNIDQKTPALQKAVVSKYNKSNVTFHQVVTAGSHGATMTLLVPMLEKMGHDAVLFLDIDCVPVDDSAIDFMFENVYNGKLIGDAQRTNHIDNNQHVFCGAHNVGFSMDLYSKIGKPSFEPTPRGDVAEELTYLARENNIEVHLLMPLSYDAPPLRMAWEPQNLPPYWSLADGMPNFGIGTTYGEGDKPLFWHCWQSSLPGQQERFWKKCEELLNG